MGCAPSRDAGDTNALAKVGVLPREPPPLPRRSQSSPWVTSGSVKKRGTSLTDLSWSGKPSWAVKAGSRRESGEQCVDAHSKLRSASVPHDMHSTEHC
jgi:hypothetical protein